MLKIDEEYAIRIREVKRKIKAMIDERGQIHEVPLQKLQPSEYATDACSVFDYMQDMPERSFLKLKMHTHNITGDSYFHYDKHQDPSAFRTATNMDFLVQDIPPELVLNEPAGGIGFSYDDGRFVNIDILRYQRIINTIYKQGILSQLSQQRSCILEIGGGYGGLAHHLSNILKNACYVIVDLPETLLFSAAYLSLLNPDKKIYVYDADNFKEFIDSKSARSFDFILLPNYRLHSLSGWRFELAVNTISFQEMNSIQVQEYLHFIHAKAKTLYTWNMDSRMKLSGISRMSEMLHKERFVFKEIPPPRPKSGRVTKLVKVLEEVGVALGVVNPPKRLPSLGEYVYRGTEYICKPV